MSISRGRLFALFASVCLAACGRVGFRSDESDSGLSTHVDSSLAVADGGRRDSATELDAGGDASGTSGAADDGADSSAETDAGFIDDAGGAGRIPGAVMLYLFDEGNGDEVVDQGTGAGANLTIVSPSSVTWGTSELES